MNAAVIAFVAAAVATSSSYGESLLDAMHGRHPEIGAAQMVVTTGDEAPITIDRRWNSRPKTAVKRILLDANSNEIGTVIFQSRCPRLPNAGFLAAELSRRIYTLASLTEPDPFVTGATRASAAQAMIEEALRHDPSIITLAFHVTPPGRTINSIAASSFGRIGKLADVDDERVMREGTTLREMTNGGNRLAIELPLLDMRGRTVGALSTSFRIDPKTDPDSIAKRAVALRDSFARKIPSLKALFRPATASRQVRGLRDCPS